jgi:hypothetical protein
MRGWRSSTHGWWCVSPPPPLFLPCPFLTPIQFPVPSLIVDSMIVSPAVSSSTATVARCALSTCACDDPFSWVERAVHQLCKLDIVHDFVDETCGPFESFTTAGLQFNQQGVEEGPSIAQDCPSDPSADVGHEGVSGDMDFLLVQRLAYFEQPFVVVTFVSKKGQD